ncbi:MAG: L-glutamate gamma-semialdehyde dehydrogenase [Armatimonadota bacterium]
MDNSSTEARIQQLGLALFSSAAHFRRGVSPHDIQAKLMEWAMQDEQAKVQLFRFVDVMPMLTTSAEVVDHLQEYLCAPGINFPLLGQFGHSGLKVAAGNKLAAQAVAAMMKSQITGMARNFIAGTNIREAAEVVRRLRKQHMAFTMDILGEVTVSDEEGLAYQQQYLKLIDGLAGDALRWEDVPGLDSAGGETIPRVNISVKLSALTPQFEPADPEGTAEIVKARLRPILSLAKTRGAFVNIDMEHSAIKDVTLKIFRELALEDEYRDWPHFGIVLQAYLRDGMRDAAEVIAILDERPAPITIRLVKGAYWDYETILARQRNWPLPVFTNKCETDAHFERMTELLLTQYPRVRLAIASHNIRSIAVAIAGAERLGLPPDAVEFQMLYGMGDPLKHAVLELGQRLRIYTPYGELLPGMAYLVRRLLENTANTSFLRQSFTEHVPPEHLLANPDDVVQQLDDPPLPERVGFTNISERNYSLAEDQQRMHAALRQMKTQLGSTYPLLIGGKTVTTGREIVSVNPASPSEVVGRVAAAGQDEARQAIAAAKVAFPAWCATPVAERAALLRRAAELLANERDRFAALELYEVGKNWREADADVCETIDYLNYYAGEMERLAAEDVLLRVPGETNDYCYQPKGLALIISPWNFPLAIFAGMTSAALVTGNTTIVKPASQSPVVAAAFVQLLQRAGMPDGVLNFLPGPGGEIGDYLVQHPDIHLIAFTGSREVGCRINRLAADITPGQRHLKKVIAEMGGKNAIIVDSDADLDEAVLGTCHSAFGYQGQKCSACSRVVVLASVYNQFVQRLVDAAGSLTIGSPEVPGNFMGPVIDGIAQQQILRYIDIGKTEATLALQRDVSHLDGYFVGPTIFTDVSPTATIAQEEIFGPVLAVMKAANLDQALEMANGVDYALTGGLFSRHPGHIEQVRRHLHAGNLYINRKITGAIVGRQPFGGFKMSGIGSKAGGPDYLRQFLDPRTITENTLRRGFAPDSE